MFSSTPLVVGPSTPSIASFLALGPCLVMLNLLAPNCKPFINILGALQYILVTSGIKTHGIAFRLRTAK